MQSFTESEDRGRKYPIGLLRLIEGSDTFVRTLSTEYGGFLTHWKSGRTVYCHGAECPAALHHTKTTWYGFCPVEVWSTDRQLWFASVLQISEHLELDMRGIFTRGQVWQIHRPVQPSTKRLPITGKLVEELDPRTLPNAFDMVPVLTHVFHETRFRLDIPNHMPPRMMAESSAGNPPRLLAEASVVVEKATTDEIRRKLQQAGFLSSKEPKRNAQ